MKTEIRAYPGGPLIVRGPIVILDEEERPVRGDRQIVALCRCGRSRIAPLCDGSHRAAQPAASARRSHGLESRLDP